VRRQYAEVSESLQFSPVQTKERWQADKSTHKSRDSHRHWMLCFLLQQISKLGNFTEWRSFL